MVLNKEVGFALPFALLLLVVVGLLLLGTAPLVSQQVTFTALNQDRLIASYVAEGGVKVAVRRVIALLESNGNHPEAIESCNETVSFLNDGATFQLNYQYHEGSHTATDPERIEVIVQTSHKDLQATARAFIVFDPQFVPGYQPPNVLDFIKGANQISNACYSTAASPRTSPWILGVNNGRNYARPTTGNGYNYILLDDVINPEFRIDYNFNFIKSSGAGGAGVLYGASDDDSAQNFTSYSARFNNHMGAFSVNKFVETPGATEPIQQLFYSTDSHAMNQTNRSGWGYMLQPNGNGTTTLDLATDKTRTDPLGNQVGRSSITFEDLKVAMDNYYEYCRTHSRTVADPSDNDPSDGIRTITIPAGKLIDGRDVPTEPFDTTRYQQEYMITVETKYENVEVQPGKIVWEKDATGATKLYTFNNDGLEKVPHIAGWEKVGDPYTEQRLRQTISIDGNPVLDFVDYSDVYTTDSFYKKQGSKIVAYDPFTTDLNYNSIIRNSSMTIDLGGTHHRTGLRVANLDTNSIKFYNTPNLGFGQQVAGYKGLIWKRTTTGIITTQ